MSKEYKSPAEIITCTFDYTGLCEEITSATISVACIKGGIDPTPAQILQGQPLIDGPLVRQRVTGGLSGTTYALCCLANDNDGERPEVVIYLDVRPRVPDEA